MEKYYCSSDIGSVTIGNETYRIAIPNIGGDGTTLCYIYDSETEYLRDRETTIEDFVTVVEGTFNIYSYDCTHGEKEDILTTITGKYFIYRSDMLIVFIKQ